jgi:hypothetical protein
LEIPVQRLKEVNDLLLDPGMTVINQVLDVVEKHGSPEEINRKARKARQLSELMSKVEKAHPEYIPQLEWLIEERNKGAFISIADYRRSILGDRAAELDFSEDRAVTLEISSCHYFPWLIMIAERAIERGELMPGRFIKVRKMVEQETDGDLAAFAAAMQIIGASYVESMDTAGTDGGNIHAISPDTPLGYFCGIGQPNDYPYKWLDECLHYYTTYGVPEVLNVDIGTVLAAYLLHRLGVDIKFKISVFMGHDNPLSALAVLMMAKLFTRDDGSTSLSGFNWSNSVTNETIEIGANIRGKLGLGDQVRFEHHITQTWEGIVAQPFLRREEIVQLARHVPNLSAKHEGGDPEVEMQRKRPSDINDYGRDKDEIMAAGNWDALTLNFWDKYDALNRTARALTEEGLSFIAAQRLHHSQ